MTGCCAPWDHFENEGEPAVLRGAVKSVRRLFLAGPSRDYEVNSFGVTYIPEVLLLFFFKLQVLAFRRSLAVNEERKKTDRTDFSFYASTR